MRGHRPVTFRVTAWPGYTLPSPGLISAGRAQEAAVPSRGWPSVRTGEREPVLTRPGCCVRAWPSAQLLADFACGARAGQLFSPLLNRRESPVWPRIQARNARHSSRLLGVRTRKRHFSLRVKACWRAIGRVNNLLQNAQMKRSN